MSRRIDEHTLRVLEFPQVLELLATYAASGLGRQEAAGLYPSSDPEWVRARLAEVSELRDLLDQDIRIPLTGLRDIRPILEHAGQKTPVLEPKELLEIGQTLFACGRLKQFFAAREDRPRLQALAAGLSDFTAILDEIDRCIENEKALKDNASPRLHEIRRQVDALENAIQDKFAAIIAHPGIRAALENDQVITRNGRAVIAVKTNYRHLVNGMVLDRSNTGSTLYIEPYALAELSNQLEDASSEERQEVGRILFELTRLVLQARAEIGASLKVLARIDLAYAKARLSQEYRMEAPQVTAGASLSLGQARHPLLLEYTLKQLDGNLQQAFRQVVPIDVRLGEDFDLLLLTGPNTGGKTVTLKTIGLLTLMAQAGLHISARPDSQIPVYRQVFADIGDEQSIQQNLSTFSAHIHQVIQILGQANRFSLVLLDELGAGTDPSEGAALATAILESLLKQGARVVATTHLGQLKNFAYSTSRAQNGSVAFDPQTLQPTYHLLIGTPGSSNALAIAERLGMAQPLIHAARGRLSNEDRGHRELINQVQTTRQAAEEQRSQAQRLMEEVRGLQRLASETLERAQAERTAAMGEADDEIARALKLIRGLFQQYAGLMYNAPKPWSEQAAQLVAEFENLAAGTNLALRQARFVASLRRGDSVLARPLHRPGIIKRINRKRQTFTLLMDGREVQIPFAETAPLP